MSLEQKHCTPCEGGTPPLTDGAEHELMKEIEGWDLRRDGDHRIEKTYTFGDFTDTMQFVNAVADVANRENHHPDMHVSFNRVRIELSTHKIKGLSENDFIMADKIDRIPRHAEVRG